MVTSPFLPTALQGKVALVTGGSSGIGLEISRHLGIHGCAVVITGRRQQVLDAAVADLSGSGVRALGMQGDVRQAEACERWVADTQSRLGRLDILVNCAAGNFLANAAELTPNGFRTVMEIDAVGTFQMSRAAFPALKACGSACIINISATLHYGATWYQVHASAAKAAVDSITRTLALEWGSYGIRTNGIAPGPIKGTAGMSKLAPGAEEAMEARVAAEVPVGHMGDKRDIALAAVYLASSAAGFINGEVLVVDGGAWLYRQPVVPREVVGQVARAVEGSSRRVGVAKGGPGGGQQRSKL